MKTLFLICLLFCCDIFTTKGQVNYAFVDSVQGVHETYNIIHHDGYLFICNTNNTCITQPQKSLTTGCALSFEQASMINSCVSVNKELLNEIVNDVFSSDERLLYGNVLEGSFFDFRIAINPQNGKPREILYAICYDSPNDCLLSIPIIRLEELEYMILDRFRFNIPEMAKNSSYIKASAMIFGGGL